MTKEPMNEPMMMGEIAAACVHGEVTFLARNFPSQNVIA
jgi:hypothetical protein